PRPNTGGDPVRPRLPCRHIEHGIRGGGGTRICTADLIWTTLRDMTMIPRCGPSQSVACTADLIWTTLRDMTMIPRCGPSQSVGSDANDTAYVAIAMYRSRTAC